MKRMIMLGSAVMVIAMTSATGALGAARQGHSARRQHRACTVGQCEQSADGGCDCVPFPTPTTGQQGTPTVTPLPQCGGATCGGPCTLPLPCSPGEACPALVQLGQCQLSAAGSCDCFPASTPTPTATPVPQCSGATCGGPCVVRVDSCPPGAPCPNVLVKGECEPTAAGDCVCVPPTPPPTPTPQCNAAACGGTCLIPAPCRSNLPCPEVSVQPGQCVLDSVGSCKCVPLSTSTPKSKYTPKPQCSGAVCAGPCVIKLCPPNALCPELLGHCEATAAGSCDCIPGRAQATP